jgi:cell division protein FtsB
MRDFQEKRRVREFFASRAVVVVLFLLVVSMGLATFRALMQSWEVERERQAIASRVEDLIRKKGSLSDKLDDLETGKGIEREARERLNLRRPGEELVIIQDHKKPDADRLATSSPASGLKNFFYKLFHVFGGASSSLAE